MKSDEGKKKERKKKQTNKQSMINTTDTKIAKNEVILTDNSGQVLYCVNCMFLHRLCMFVLIINMCLVLQVEDFVTTVKLLLHPLTTLLQ